MLAYITYSSYLCNIKINPMKEFRETPKGCGIDTANTNLEKEQMCINVNCKYRETYKCSELYHQQRCVLNYIDK